MKNSQHHSQGVCCELWSPALCRELLAHTALGDAQPLCLSLALLLSTELIRDTFSFLISFQVQTLDLPWQRFGWPQFLLLFFLQSISLFLRKDKQNQVLRRENCAQKAKCFNKRKKGEKNTVLFSLAAARKSCKSLGRSCYWRSKRLTEELPGLEKISRKRLAPSTSHFPSSNLAS